MQIVTYAFYFHRNHNLLNQVQTITVEAAECWILYNKKNQSTCSRIVFSHCKWKFGLDHLQSSTIRVHFHTSHLVFKSSLISTFFIYSWRQWYYQYFTRIYKEMLHAAGKTWNNNLPERVQEIQSHLSQGNIYTYVMDGTLLKFSRGFGKFIIYTNNF